MPAAKNFLNAFTKRDVNRITGLSCTTIDYLARQGFLEPAYRDTTRGVSGATQGRVRYYSYRDLVIAKIIAKLIDSGLRLAKLRSAIRALRNNDNWQSGGGSAADAVKWLVFDGNNLLLMREDGFLDELRSGGQRSFAFVVGIERTKQEVLSRLEPEKLLRFSMDNLDLVESPTRRSNS